MSKNRHRNRNKDKKEITLMTLLAHEATSDSRKLLKRHGKEDAKNYDDLEAKLAEFYFTFPDKKSLEKELAEIHPHKKWILRVSASEVKKEEPIHIDEIKTTETIVAPVAEEKSNACGCPSCVANSSFDGPSVIKRVSTLEFIGGAAILAIAVGLVVHYNNK